MTSVIADFVLCDVWLVVSAAPAAVNRFAAGEIDRSAWRAFRLVHGTYGQRQQGCHSMLRVKIPQRVLRAEQLETIAEAARRFSQCAA